MLSREFFGVLYQMDSFDNLKTNLLTDAGAAVTNWVVVVAVIRVSAFYIFQQYN